MQSVERNTTAHSLQWRLPHRSAVIYRSMSEVLSLSFEQILTLLSQCMYFSILLSCLSISHTHRNIQVNTHLLTCLLAKRACFSSSGCHDDEYADYPSVARPRSPISLSASLSLGLWLVKLIGSPSVLQSYIFQKLNGLLHSSQSMCPSWSVIDCGELCVCIMREGGSCLVSCSSVLVWIK